MISPVNRRKLCELRIYFIYSGPAHLILETQQSNLNMVQRFISLKTLDLAMVSLRLL